MTRGSNTCGFGIRHLNNDLLCALAIRTNGMDVTKHRIVEIALLPLDYQLNLSKKVRPISLLLRDTTGYSELPASEAIRVNEFGMDYYSGAEAFETWVEKNRLGKDKRIAMLTYNYFWARPFLIKWLSRDGYYNCFEDHQVRDLQIIARFLNDRFDHAGDYPVPFFKTKFSWMAKVCGIDLSDLPHKHNAVVRANITRLMYAKILNGFLPLSFRAVDTPSVIDAPEELTRICN